MQGHNAGIKPPTNRAAVVVGVNELLEVTPASL